MDHSTRAAVPLGRIVITSNALAILLPEDVSRCLIRHASGDWGDLCSADKKLNNDALLTGHRILSSYKDGEGVKFWIITEHDRSVTTVLLPEDY